MTLYPCPIITTMNSADPSAPPYHGECFAPGYTTEAMCKHLVEDNGWTEAAFAEWYEAATK